MADKTNVHHLAYPRNWYRKAGGVAWEYYNLPCMQVRLPVEIHDEIHATTRPMSMARLETMVHRVYLYNSGKCGCTHHPPKPISLDQERKVRRGGRSG